MSWIPETLKVAVTLSLTKLRIATRKSPLALWQANHVAELLRQVEPGLEVSMVSMDTFGDRRRDLSIAQLGGKGVFSKEVQQLVLAGEADIAVHSAKDLQAITPEGLTIAAFPERGDCRDALVGCRLADLAAGASVAAGSNRRSSLLLDKRPDLKIHGLRGNIATRVAAAERHDAVIVASVALERLGLQPEVVEHLDPTDFVPQVGQGALAVEVRSSDTAVYELVSAINDELTAKIVSAERSFLIELGGDCELPAGAHAEVVDGLISVRGVLAGFTGGPIQRAVEAAPASAEPGRMLARRLRKMVEADAA